TAALRRVAEKTDGWLEVDVTAAVSGDPSGRSYAERRRVGRITGTEAFAIRPARARLEAAREAMAAADRTLRRSNIDDRSLERAVRDCGESIEALSQAPSAHSAVLSFL